MSYFAPTETSTFVSLLLNREICKVQRLTRNKIDHSLGRKTDFLTFFQGCVNADNDYEIAKAINMELGLAQLRVHKLKLRLKQLQGV